MDIILKVSLLLGKLFVMVKIFLRAVTIYNSLVYQIIFNTCIYHLILWVSKNQTIEINKQASLPAVEALEKPQCGGRCIMLDPADKERKPIYSCSADVMHSWLKGSEVWDKPRLGLKKSRTTWRVWSWTDCNQASSDEESCACYPNSEYDTV